LLQAAARDHVAHIAALPGLARDAVRGVRRLRRRAKERSDHPDLAKLFNTPPTFLNHVVSPGRRFATASLSLQEVKETAKHLGVTFNDIVLAVAAGGLRELLLRYDGRADRPLMASVPVATDTSPDRITGNEIGGLSVSLPVHIDDPLERVRVTSLATARAKENYELLGPELQGQLMEYLPPPITPALLRWQSQRAAHNKLMNVAVSSVPGPRERGHIGGAPVTEIYSIGVLSAGSAFNMTVWSYVDQVDISVLSDDITFNDVHEATDAMVHGLSEIRSAAGLPPLTDVDTAMAPATALS
jgi:WS/DGAT/MGAT family acyltransferase